MLCFFFLSFWAEYTLKCLQGRHFWKDLWEAWAVFSRTHSLYSSLSSPPRRTSQLPLTVVVTEEASFVRERAITAKAGALGGSSISVSHPPRTAVHGVEGRFPCLAQLDPGLHPSFVTYRTETLGPSPVWESCLLCKRE